MTLIPKACIEYDEPRKICVAEEKGKKYTLENVSGFRIQKIKIDGCVEQLKDEKRCDYLFKIETREPKRAVFVELKGGDIVTAVKQVEQSINYLKKELSEYEVVARIVGSGNVPSLKNNPAYQKLIRIIPPEHFLYRTNRNYTEKI